MKAEKASTIPFTSTLLANCHYRAMVAECGWVFDAAKETLTPQMKKRHSEGECERELGADFTYFSYQAKIRNPDLLTHLTEGLICRVLGLAYEAAMPMIARRPIGAKHHSTLASPNKVTSSQPGSRPL